MIFSLIGPRGAGKTTIAVKLSELMKWPPAVSTDAEVEKLAQKSIAKIVEAEGWNAFRRYESEALAAIVDHHQNMSDPPPGVILDTGGGVVLSEKNRELLKTDGFVIYLRADAETLAKRIRDDSGRPPLTDCVDPLVEMKQILAERSLIYEAMADLVVDTDELGISACLTILEQWVLKRCGTCELV